MSQTPPPSEAADAGTAAARELLHCLQGAAAAAGHFRTPRPQGAGLESRVRRREWRDQATEPDPNLPLDEQHPRSPSGWRAAPGMAYSRTGVGPSRYDPQPLGVSVQRLLKPFSKQLREYEVMAHWGEIVGPALAAKTVPTKIAEQVLEIRAESSAWAAQVRLHQATILRAIDSRCGEGIVKQLRVLGPGSGISWARGQRSVPGRGVRDTYG